MTTWADRPCPQFLQLISEMWLQLRGITTEGEVTDVVKRDAEIRPDLSTHGTPALAEGVIL